MLQKNVIPTVISFVKLTTRIIFIANLRGYVKKKLFYIRKWIRQHVKNRRACRKALVS